MTSMKRLSKLYKLSRKKPELTHTAFQEPSEDVLDATEKFCEIEIPLRDGVLRLHQAFSLACQIAVKLSVPMFVQGPKSLSHSPCIVPVGKC
jgi:hypothetical protein